MVHHLNGQSWTTLTTSPVRGCTRLIIIIDDMQRRTLEYIAAVNRGGWQPTAREINEWRLRPEPRPAKRGRLLEAAIPAVPSRRVPKQGGTTLGALLQNSLWPHQTVADVLADSFKSRISLPKFAFDSGLLRQAADFMASSGLVSNVEYETIPGSPGREAVYAPTRPPEKFLAHLRRLGWVERNNRRRYAITPLGHALLRADTLEEVDSEQLNVMLLDADSELAYGQVMGVIAACGDAPLILDAYLGTQELVDMLKHTNASRFLIGTKLGKARVTELSITVGLTPIGPSGTLRELRQTDFHDRWLVGDDEVYGMGTSLNGLGKSPTTLVKMPDVVASFMRQKAEELWSSASVLAISNAAGKSLDPREKLVRELSEQVDMEDGRYTHSGCNVRHRSRDAAIRCIAVRLQSTGQ